MTAGGFHVFWLPIHRPPLRPLCGSLESHCGGSGVVGVPTGNIPTKKSVTCLISGPGNFPRPPTRPANRWR
jgi:hypothetical protein